LFSAFAAVAIDSVVVDCPIAGDGLGVADLAVFDVFELAPIAFVRLKATPQAKATAKSPLWATRNFFCIAQCGTVPLPFNWNVCSHGNAVSRFLLSVSTILQTCAFQPGGVDSA